MKRMTVFLALACACALSLAGCAKDAQTSKDAAADNTVQAEPETVYEYPAEDAGPVLEESRLGYSMTFDPTVFTLDDTGEGSDIYTYHTAETLEGPAYIAVQSYPDMDAQTLADGLALQSARTVVVFNIFGAARLIIKVVGKCRSGELCAVARDARIALGRDHSSGLRVNDLFARDDGAGAAHLSVSRERELGFWRTFNEVS